MPEIDPLTGLPALPEGYFWRVKFVLGPFGIYYAADVSLRRKNFWRSRVASHEIRLQYLDPRDAEAGRKGHNRHYDYIDAAPEDFPKYVLEAAQKTLKSQEAALKYEAYNKKAKQQMDALAGDYPPKTLRTE